ncbi:MAG: virulence factor [Myxococcota bacterium]|nr:virulence factor [Myxococcota bacterium]
MERLITIYWRDIPAQVIGRRGRKSAVKQTLDPRFERAIDRAAMRAGHGSSDKYLADWRRESQPCGPDLEQEVSAEVTRLENLFPPDVLTRVIRAAGLLEDQGK